MPYNNDYNKMVARDIDYFNRKYIVHCGTTGQGTIDYRSQMLGGCDTCSNSRAIGAGAGSKVFASGNSESGSDYESDTASDNSDEVGKGGAILGFQAGTVLGGPKFRNDISQRRLLSSFSSLGAPIELATESLNNPAGRPQDTPPGASAPPAGAPPAGAPAPPAVGGAILGPVRDFNQRYTYQNPEFYTAPPANRFGQKVSFSSLGRPNQPMTGVMYRAGKNAYVRDLGEGNSLSSDEGYTGAGNETLNRDDSDSGYSSSDSDDPYKRGLNRREYAEQTNAVERNRAFLDGGYCGKGQDDEEEESESEEPVNVVGEAGRPSPGAQGAQKMRTQRNIQRFTNARANTASKSAQYKKETEERRANQASKRSAQKQANAEKRAAKQKQRSEEGAKEKESKRSQAKQKQTEESEGRQSKQKQSNAEAKQNAQKAREAKQNANKQQKESRQKQQKETRTQKQNVRKQQQEQSAKQRQEKSQSKVNEAKTKAQKEVEAKSKEAKQPVPKQKEPKQGVPKQGAPKQGAPAPKNPSNGPTWLTTANKLVDLGLQVVKMIGNFKMFSENPVDDFMNMYEDELCDDLPPNPTMEQIIECLKSQDYDDDEIQKLLSLSQGALGEQAGKEVSQSLKAKISERQQGNKDKNTACMDAMNEVGDSREQVTAEQMPVRKQISYFGSGFQETVNATSGVQRFPKVSAQMNSRIGYGKKEAGFLGNLGSKAVNQAVKQAQPNQVGEAKGKPNKRAEIVRNVMKEKGMSMIEASKFVKANGLY